MPLVDLVTGIIGNNFVYMFCNKSGLIRGGDVRQDEIQITPWFNGKFLFAA